MSAKLNVVTVCVVDNLPIGTALAMDEKEAERLDRLGFVRIVGPVVEPVVEAAAETKESAPSKADEPAQDEAPKETKRKIVPTRKAGANKK